MKVSNSTKLFWDAGRTYDLRGATTKIKYSDRFCLKTDPSADFALFVDCTGGMCDYIKFGVIAKNVDENKPVKARVQFWVCDANDGKAHEHTAEKVIFDQAEQKCEFGTTSDAEIKFFENVYHSELNVLFGCKLTVLDPPPRVPNFKDLLVQNLRDAYENEAGTDTIIVAGGKEYKASRFVLCAHSSVFRNMFSGNFKESITGKVEVKDISAAAMEAFIKWMYVGEFTNIDIIEELFVIADKYMVDDLRTNCADLMHDTLTEANAAQRLVLAAKYNLKGLKQKILKFIHEKGPHFTHKVYQSKVWFDYLKLEYDTET